ncbi:prostate and testis expressed protein 3 [Rousettus aegyptiacus]|uniref:Prostate and testis expressed 3 n=1 Tax=Rousettus aegyptiacus TaxID=9407 RepID=A0A7J8H493_ROUAE|nr:prostate and testis expressed protein 3 [Rousettus aegyptiacus]KAF6466920.1 prostate and testis expressed 3 [Rousettus aegyptiacus]
MDKCFLLIFILFCFIEAVTPLKCITCHLHLKADRCRKGSGVCVAKKDATCMTLKIFKGVDLQLLYLECQKFCRNLTYELNDQTYVHKCCNHDYCNFEP